MQTRSWCNKVLIKDKTSKLEDFTAHFPPGHGWVNTVDVDWCRLCNCGKGWKRDQFWELKYSRVTVSAVKSLFWEVITTLSKKKKNLSAKLLVLINKNKGKTNELECLQSKYHNILWRVLMVKKTVLTRKIRALWNKASQTALWGPGKGTENLAWERVERRWEDLI